MFEGHDPYLVALSVVIAILGGYTGFGLAARIRGTPGVSRACCWRGPPAFLAVGIWTMHFVGMLAAPIPPDAVYLVLPTIISFLICALVVGISLFFVSIGEPSLRRVVSSAVLLGLGIASMHYVGIHGLAGNFAIGTTPDDPAVDRYRDHHRLWRPARFSGPAGRRPADRKLDRVRRRGLRHALHRDVRHAFRAAVGGGAPPCRRACCIAANPVDGCRRAVFCHRRRFPVVAGAGSAPATGGRVVPVDPVGEPAMPIRRCPSREPAPRRG